MGKEKESEGHSSATAEKTENCVDYQSKLAEETKRLAWATIFLAIATAVMAFLSFQEYGILRQQYSQLNRPIIIIEDTNVLNESDSYTLSITIKNVGKLTGRITNVLTGGAFVNTPEEVGFDIFPDQTRRIAIANLHKDVFNNTSFGVKIIYYDYYNEKNHSSQCDYTSKSPIDISIAECRTDETPPELVEGHALFC